ncbi:exodeoxyribonuclease VII small subunit [Demequina aurantiaca]|uniref:exodeoxyribonuclease VII small subunit n=1 Tax=Demequina aurantiaca TaxID=676200 RepID=UPI0009FE6366
MKNPTDDVAALSYEDARDELIAIVAKLETGSATLDESLGLWERGEALAARCQDLLDGARDRITEARGDADAADAGVVGVVPADDSSLTEATDTEEAHD